MRNAVSGAPLNEHAETSHMVAAVEKNAALNPDGPVVSVRDGNQFRDRSAAEFWAGVQAIAVGLIASGVAAGDRVGLMSATRVEWLELDLAINAAGAVTVPIYETSSADQVQWILDDSGAVLFVAETDEMLQMVKSVSLSSGCREFLSIESGAMHDLVDRGGEDEVVELQNRLAGISSDQIATIIYTSGTTGRPKGCVLTHRNLQVNVDQVSDALAGTIGSSDTALLFLPLAHVLSKITALYCLAARIPIAFATSIANLPEELGMVQPTLISGVPRIFEKVFSKAQHTAESDGKGKIFDRAAATAIRWSQERNSGTVRRRTAIEHWVFSQLVYGKINAAFGGNLRMAFSGGGPLGERLTSFFDGIGLRIYEGYGLTETSPILTINRTDAWCPGSVGLPVAETSLQIDHDGQILAKGPQVFQGYWRNEEATSEVIDSEGWFHTGDVGEVDDGGFVHITGRMKDIIVTAAGKNVAPAPLEDRLRAHSLISQAMLVGDRRPFVAALISIDEEAIGDWIDAHGLAGKSMSDLVDDDALRAEIQAAVDDANRTVSRPESIREFVIVPHDLAMDRDEVTPTFKVRRMVVMEHYSDLIDSIYR